MNRSIAAIHRGNSVASPGFGRDHHCLTARRSTNAPRTSSTHEAAEDDRPLPAGSVPTMSRTTVVTPAIPTTHPTKKPTPAPPALGVSSMRTTATIGTGKIATTAASGSRSPTTRPTSSPPAHGTDCGVGPDACRGGSPTRPRPGTVLLMMTPAQAWPHPPTGPQERGLGRGLGTSWDRRPADQRRSCTCPPVFRRTQGRGRCRAAGPSGRHENHSGPGAGEVLGEFLLQVPPRHVDRPLPTCVREQ